MGTMVNMVRGAQGIGVADDLDLPKRREIAADTETAYISIV